MNKKIIKSLALTGALAVGIGVGVSVGTHATYKKTFKSTENTVRSANFNVDVKDSNGTFTDRAFTLVGKDLKPGTSKNVYEFEITKDAEVDVEYEVLLKNEGELFKAGTPVNARLEKLVDESWQKVDSSYKYKPSSNKDKFRIMINWPKDTAGVNDADFAGKEGKINITINATQVVEPENLVEMHKDFSSVVVDKNRKATMTYEGREGSWVTLKVQKGNGNLYTIDQGTVNNGKCQFNVTFGKGTYIVTMNGSKGKVQFDSFEIK